MENTLSQYGTWQNIKDGKLPWHKEKPETKVKELERELNAIKEEVNKLKNELKQAHKENKNLQTELEQAKYEKEDKSQITNSLQNKNKTLTEKLNQLNDEKGEMTSSINTLVQECEGYHHLLQNERNKTASLAEEIQAKAKALVHWDVDKEELE
ncbi:MAG: hypothetical protein V4471_00365 [Pseudomonadota bacterium]